MEIPKFQQLDLLNNKVLRGKNTFELLKENNPRAGYFKGYHARNKFKRNLAKRIKYESKKNFGLNFELGKGGVFMFSSMGDAEPHAHTHNISKKEKSIYEVNAKREKSNCGRKIEKVLNRPQIRIKTKEKRPKRNNWVNWYERLTMEILKERNGEVGARTGKQVKYLGRTYWLYLWDEDFDKVKKTIPEAIRREIDTKSIIRNQKWKVSYTNTTHGRHTIILSRHKLPNDIIIRYGDYKPTELLGNKRQFILEGAGKTRIEARRPFRIIKNFRGLRQLFKDYQITTKREEKRQQKLKGNIKVYQPLKSTQNIKEMLKQYKVNELFKIQKQLTSIEAVAEMGKMEQPYKCVASGFSFYCDAYFSNQAKLNDLLWNTPTLEIKRGTHHFFLNRIC